MSGLSSLRAGLPPAAGQMPQSARAGQAAFFRAALGAAQAPAAQRGPVDLPAKVEAQPARTPEPALAPEGGMPSRLLRPGSLLDIRV